MSSRGTVKTFYRGLYRPENTFNAGLFTLKFIHVMEKATLAWKKQTDCNATTQGLKPAWTVSSSKSTLPGDSPFSSTIKI